MLCSLPPHHLAPLAFPTYTAYETHYLSSHLNRCSTCLRNFPTPHVLNLHIEENHDPLNLARRARGDKTFACLVEGCDRKCSSREKRRRHGIDKHAFPKDYDFRIVDTGIDGRLSLLRTSSTPVGRRGRRRSSVAVAEGANGKGVGMVHTERRRERRASVGRPVADEAMDEQRNGSGSDSDSYRGGDGSERDEMDAEASSSAPRGEKAAKRGEETAGEEEGVDTLTTSLAALRFVPPSVSRKGLAAAEKTQTNAKKGNAKVTGARPDTGLGKEKKRL